jgi:hypothetical protein
MPPILVTSGGIEYVAVATKEARPACADEALLIAAGSAVSEERPEETCARMEDLYEESWKETSVSFGNSFLKRVFYI